ncbi:hypothetical protein CW357_00895 [Rummeliibacillus sp. TYF005]|uniref:hypothetical protein n=1 Tax=Rummeliibacillus sp. TYF005 TaxID=2058214 RepID=UPI000F5387BF|nr:hypothetical protein [Rummeliibacillus sp. TYF005]RPJ97256.1 hypothetical protein CW357_00895 [Rummeliibacillus sp. TYF005]
MNEKQKSSQPVAADSEEEIIEHDYKYLQSILSNCDIERLLYAISIGKPIIVEGIQGPTGKSTLVRYLQERGANAIEYNLSEVFTLNEFLEEKNLNPFKSFFQTSMNNF